MKRKLVYLPNKYSKDVVDNINGYFDKGYEIENIFHTGKQFYAGFYRSYYKAYYTKEKQKVKKKVNGKIKTVTKTVKIKHRKLMRDNYIYSLTNL